MRARGFTSQRELKFFLETYEITTMGLICCLFILRVEGYFCHKVTIFIPHGVWPGRSPFVSTSVNALSSVQIMRWNP